LKKFAFTVVAGFGLFVGGTVVSAAEQTHVVANQETLYLGSLLLIKQRSKTF